MPYIQPSDRIFYEEVLSKLPPITKKGDLEFIIFWVMQQFRKTRDERYSNLHDATYAAAHCADEFRRRYLDKREDVARETNGDVNP